MKLCPTCRSQYTDDTLRYCLSDGTPLVKESSPESPQKTLLLPDFQGQSNRKTQPVNPFPQTEQHSPRAEPTFLMASPGQSKKSLIPWIIGGAILFLGVIGAGLAALFMLSGAGNNQSAANGNSSASSNSRLSRNTNANQTQSNTPARPPYAAFTDRVGRYEGEALNTTYNSRGTIRLDIKTINADTGAVSSMLTSGGNLCGDASLTGKITDEEKMNLSGPITCAASNYKGGMTVRCQFTAADKLACTYVLKNPKGHERATQEGNFNLTKR